MGAQETESFDAIVVGSGMGGLATAALLARLGGMSVLVLEQHHTLGGFTHSFSRQGQYTWDVGLHYVGGMGPDETGRRLMDFLSEDRLEWHPLPDPYDVFVYPEMKFGVPVGPEAYRTKLTERFPDEEEALEQYFQDLKRAAGWLRMRMFSKSLPNWLRSPFDWFNDFRREFALRTTGSYMESNFRDPGLRSLLVSHWGDYGLLPSESAFTIHAIVTRSYLSGAFYPVGGASQLAQTIRPTIEERGGMCRTGESVDEILIEKGVTTGVRVEVSEDDGETFNRYSAPVVISCAGARNTYLKLLPDSVQARLGEWIEEIRTFPSGRSFVTLYLGLCNSPEKLGVSGENYWIHSKWVQDRNPDRVGDVIRGSPVSCFVSFGSMNDPEAEHHTAQIISSVHYEEFDAWSSESWPRRDEEYQELKETIAEGLLDLAETAVPGLRELVEYREVSTPLSVEHFTEHLRGAPYGIPALPQRFRKDWIDVDTPVEGLYLTGTDVGSPGIMGAAFGGLFTAGRVMGGFGGLWKIFRFLR